MAEVSLEEAPKKARDLYQRAFTAFERNNLDFAIELFTTSLDLEPRLLQARKYLRAAEVRQCKEKKTNHQISSLKGALKKGGVGKAIKKGDGILAVQKAEELLRIDALNPEFVMLFSDAAEAADLPEAAIQTMEIAREHHPSDRKLLKALAELYARLEMFSHARDIYQDISDMDPTDQNALRDVKNMAAKATVEDGNWESTGGHREILKDKDLAEQLEKEQASEKTSEDVDLLVADAKAKIEREPKNLNYRRALGDLYLKAEMFEEALEAYAEANEAAGGADPQVDAMISRTTLCIYDQNIAYYEENGQAAEAEAEREEREKFRLEDTADKVRRYPNDLKFKFDYGVLLLENGDVNDAIPHFQAASRSPDRRTEALLNLGKCFRGKGQNDIAIEQLEKAVSEIQVMNDTKKNIFYLLGGINEDMGRKKEALEFYKEIYAVDFGYKDVQDKVDRGYSDEDGSTSDSDEDGSTAVTGT